jgi:ADP-dependent NAD(P)H-hydrate dehydratase / NAD(P)H-hydrate epimerase
MRILNAAQMREADRLTTERHSIPSLQLMANAGAGVVSFLQKMYPDLVKQRIAVLCGKGNNGGDGFVVARLLKQLGANPHVLLFATPDSLRGDAAVNFEVWKQMGGGAVSVTDSNLCDASMAGLANHTIIADALLGTGLSGPVQGVMAQAIEGVNKLTQGIHRRPKVLAVDMPSGLPSDGAAAGGPVIRADWTVTFTAPKIGQLMSPDCESVGMLVVHTIGTPRSVVEEVAAGSSPELRWLEPGEFREIPFLRRADSNKGTYGHALVVAGSRGKAGAAALAGWGALRAGAGLVTVATPEDSLPVVASYRPELMTTPLAQTDAGTISPRNFEYNRFADLLRDKSVLAIGPGLSMQVETQQFVMRVLADCPLPIVLDADGLNALAAAPSPPLERRSPALSLTPHPGEMARLLGCTTAEVQGDRLAAARRAAKKFKAYVVLKGFHTIIASTEGAIFINSTGNPGMATAGTGDVLTGILAGLTAQFGVKDWARVLGLGVYLHGLAGDLALARAGEAPLIASDLIEAIPTAFAQIRSELGAEQENAS